MSVWKKICAIKDIGDGEMRGFAVEGKQVAVAKIGGEQFAFENKCTHADCDLTGGTIDDHVVLCWCHGSQFDVRTGEVKSPPADKPLATYKLKTEGEDLLVEI